MTSKEQLAYYKQQCEEQANYIIELQLQIEQLEDSAKIKAKQVDEYATTLKEKYLDLKQENEKLKNENKENAEFYVKSRDALWDLKQQNEKLKKAIEIMIREKIKPSAFLGILKDYQYHNKVDIPYEKVSIYLDCDLTQQEYELIKEVLGNGES